MMMMDTRNLNEIKQPHLTLWIETVGFFFCFGKMDRADLLGGRKKSEVGMC